MSGRRQCGKRRTELTKQLGPLAYSRPPGARVALLRSPILRTATRKLKRKDRNVQPRITHGEPPADISNASKQRTFLMRFDRKKILLKPVARAPHWVHDCGTRRESQAPVLAHPVDCAVSVLVWRASLP